MRSSLSRKFVRKATRLKAIGKKGSILPGISPSKTNLRIEHFRLVEPMASHFAELEFDKDCRSEVLQDPG
jgi:hypothetical protein